MELVSYAIDFVSFLFQNLKNDEISKIKSVILFGSVARDEADKKSDVDLFIAVIGENRKIEKSVFGVKNKFFDSVKFKKYWRLLGVNNEMNILVGRLKEWKLRDSMLGSSITLYQKYTSKLEDGKSKVILIWGVIKNNSKRIMLNKRILGYTYYGKKYKGILEICEGEKLGSNVIILPVEHLSLLLKEFRKFKVPVKIKNIFEYK